MKTLLSLLVLLATFLPSEAALFDSEFRAGGSNIYFISPRRDNRTGTGTITDPFNGNTAAKLDNLIYTNAAEGRTYRLLPGVYYTRGMTEQGVDSMTNFTRFPPNNYSIIGSGWDTHVILLATNRTGSNLQLAFFNSAATTVANNSPSTNFTVKDIWLDANWRTNTLAISNLIKANGIFYDGENATFENIKLTGLWAVQSLNQESFGLSATTRTNNGMGGGHRILNNVVTDWTTNMLWDAISCINVGYSGAPNSVGPIPASLVHGNSVYPGFNQASNSFHGAIGINVGAYTDVANNSLLHCTLFNDTPPFHDVSIRGNSLFGYLPVRLVTSDSTNYNGYLTTSNIVFSGNSITYLLDRSQPDYGGYVGAIFGAASVHQTNIGWVISDNTFNVQGLVTNTYALVMGSQTNVVVRNNWFSEKFINNVADVSTNGNGVYGTFHNNRKFTGEPITNRVHDNPGYRAILDGDLQFIYRTGASNSYILTSDNQGRGTWVPNSAASNIHTNMTNMGELYLQVGTTGVTYSGAIRFATNETSLEYRLLDFDGLLSFETFVGGNFYSRPLRIGTNAVIYMTGSNGTASAVGQVWTAYGTDGRGTWSNAPASVGSESTAPGTNLVMVGTTLSLSNSIINDSTKSRSNSTYLGGTLTAGQWASWSSNGTLHFTAPHGSVLTLGSNGVILTNGTALASGGGGGSVATDTIWDAAGDLAVGTGADTAARLAIGANQSILTSTGAGAAWSNTIGGVTIQLSGMSSNQLVVTGEDGQFTNLVLNADQFVTNVGTASGSPSLAIKSGGVFSNFFLGTTNGAGGVPFAGERLPAMLHLIAPTNYTSQSSGNTVPATNGLFLAGYHNRGASFGTNFYIDSGRDISANLVTNGGRIHLSPFASQGGSIWFGPLSSTASFGLIGNNAGGSSTPHVAGYFMGSPQNIVGSQTIITPGGFATDGTIWHGLGMRSIGNTANHVDSGFVSTGTNRITAAGGSWTNGAYIQMRQATVSNLVPDSVSFAGFGVTNIGGVAYPAIVDGNTNTVAFGGFTNQNGIRALVVYTNGVRNYGLLATNLAIVTNTMAIDTAYTAPLDRDGFIYVVVDLIGDTTVPAGVRIVVDGQVVATAENINDFSVVQTVPAFVPRGATYYVTNTTVVPSVINYVSGRAVFPP